MMMVMVMMVMIVLMMVMMKVVMMVLMVFQVRYKADGRKKLSCSLYSQLPDTTDTQHAKHMTDLQSDVTHTLHSCSPV